MTFSTDRPTLYNREPYTFVNSSSLPPHILSTILRILKSWDQASTDYTYTTQFHSDGALHVSPEPSVGHEAMRQLHDSMIHPVSGPIVNLQHYLDRAFLMPSPTGGKSEVVFTGKLTSVLKGGEEVTTDFATWIVMSPGADGAGGEGEQESKVELLRVFSDTSALTAKIGGLFAKGP
jgi:hypothetical protein